MFTLFCISYSNRFSFSLKLMVKFSDPNKCSCLDKLLYDFHGKVGKKLTDFCSSWFDGVWFSGNIVSMYFQKNGVKLMQLFQQFRRGSHQATSGKSKNPRHNISFKDKLFTSFWAKFRIFCYKCMRNVPCYILKSFIFTIEFWPGGRRWARAVICWLLK